MVKTKTVDLMRANAPYDLRSCILMQVVGGLAIGVVCAGYAEWSSATSGDAVTGTPLLAGGEPLCILFDIVGNARESATAFVTGASLLDIQRNYCPNARRQFRR